MDPIKTNVYHVKMINYIYRLNDHVLNFVHLKMMFIVHFQERFTLTAHKTKLKEELEDKYTESLLFLDSVDIQQMMRMNVYQIISLIP